MSDIKAEELLQAAEEQLKTTKYSRAQRRAFHKMFGLPKFGKQFESYARGKVKL